MVRTDLVDVFVRAHCHSCNQVAVDIEVLGVRVHHHMCTMLQRVHAQWLVKVLSCHNLSGRYDYQLEVVGVDLDSFAEFVRIHIRALPGVREISTSFRSQRLSGLVGCLLLRGTSITLLRQSKSSFHCPSKQRLNRFKIMQLARLEAGTAGRLTLQWTRLGHLK